MSLAQESDLAPDMRRVLIHQSQRRVSEEKLGNDQESNIFLAVQGLLEDMTAVAISRKVDNPAPVRTLSRIRMMDLS